jgi:CheY-like chemotaxis protein
MDRPPSVLVVDDHPEAGGSLAQLLALLGYAARHAPSAADALRLAAEDPPDVVVLEVRLRGWDGYDLAARLSPAAGPRPVFIALTTWPDREGKSLAAGFAHHFLKPVEPAALLSVLEALARG